MEGSPEASHTTSVAMPDITPAATAAVVKKPSPPRITDFTTLVTTRRCVSAAIVVLMSCYFVGNNWHDVFQYHPLMMTVGFVGLLPEIVHLSNNFRRCRSMSERQQTLDRHLQFALGMKLCGLLGFAAIEASKIQRKKLHFTTWHGQIGLLCIFVLALQVVVGLVSHFRLGPSKKLQAIYPILRKVHFYLGLVLLLLAVISMYLGLQSNFALKAVTNHYTRQLFGAVTTLLVGWSYLRE